MDAQGLIAKRMKNGRWKVRVWGQPNDHFGDWSGENARIRTAPEQPHNGFEAIEDALAYAKRVFPTHEDCRAWGFTVGDGASCTNADFEGSIEADKHWYGTEGMIRKSAAPTLAGKEKG